jgi:hypothetical protein
MMELVTNWEQTVIRVTNIVVIPQKIPHHHYISVAPLGTCRVLKDKKAFVSIPPIQKKI